MSNTVQRVSWRNTTEPEGPSPWLPLTIIKPKERPESAKQKARYEATLAETTKQVNTMIGEYFDLHSLSTEPERVSNMTTASEASSANIQLQTEHVDEQLIHTISADGQIDRSFRSILSKHPIGNRACRQATHSHNLRRRANWASRQACQKANWTRQKAKWACRRGNWAKRWAHSSICREASRMANWAIRKAKWANRRAIWEHWLAQQFDRNYQRSSDERWTYLAKLHILIGRWSRDTFLRYIRKQVEQFSNVAKKMLTFRSFRHIPDIAPRRVTMPRRGEILDVANHDGRSYQHYLCTPNQQTGRCNTINGGASISDHRRRKRGIAEGEERGELNIYLSIPNPNHQCTSGALLSLIAFRRGVWRRSYFATHRFR